jgi:hypothetical protein
LLPQALNKTNAIYTITRRLSPQNIPKSLRRRFLTQGCPGFWTDISRQEWDDIYCLSPNSYIRAATRLALKGAKT